MPENTERSRANHRKTTGNRAVLRTGENNRRGSASGGYH